ncbi:hypothetical protein ACRZOU_001238 [Aeromonas salmonicida]
MIAITSKHTAQSPADAVAYLVRHAARIETLASGRACVLEGVAA